MNSIGDYIRQQREQAKISLRQLADQAGVSNGPVPDEHLVPGRGRQPCAELLRGIAATGYRGMVCAEVNTRRAQTRDERLADLTETLAFARTHLASVPVT